MTTTRWDKLRSLTFSGIWFLVQAAVAVVAFDLAFRLFFPEACVAFIERKGGSFRKENGVSAQRMAWLVEVADRYAPGKSSCLRHSAALAWLLRRRGIETSLRIGVARDGERFVAHSWVESGDGELYGLSDSDKYAPLSSLGLPEPLRTGFEQ